MAKVLEFILRNHLGDAASVAGLCLGFVGFALTLLGVWRSKSAAERAEEAAGQARRAIISAQTIADFSTALAVMGEVKRLQRVAAWALVPDRYSLLRSLLVAIRTTRQDLQPGQLSVLQGAIQQVSDLEKKVEHSLLPGSEQPNSAKLNALISGQLDKLTELVSELQREVGR